MMSTFDFEVHVADSMFAFVPEVLFIPTTT